MTCSSKDSMACITNAISSEDATHKRVAKITTVSSISTRLQKH